MTDISGQQYWKKYFFLTKKVLYSHFAHQQYLQQLVILRLPSLKPTASLHLKMDAWNTYSRFLLGETAHFQGRKC